jgi:hypothetical protein
MLAACASPEGAYPSLAIRDAERWSGTLEVAAQPYVPATTAAPTLVSAVQLAAAARALHAEFLAAAPAARRSVAAADGAGPGSDGWAVAQVALADLESRRSRMMVTLADLDRLYADTSNAGEAIAPIADERADVVAMIDEESALIAQLLARLSR